MQTTAKAHAIKHATARAILAACIAAMPLALAACGGQVRSSELEEVVRDDAERFDEARRIAQRGERAHRFGNLDDAYRYYTQALDVYPRFALARNNLGLVLMERQAYLDAVTQFRLAAEIQPADPRPLTNLGLVYLEAGWPQDAFDPLERALRIDPTYLPALRAVAQAASDTGRATQDDLTYIKTALLSERDPEWREYLERERFRIENRRRLENERLSQGSSADPTIRGDFD